MVLAWTVWTLPLQLKMGCCLQNTNCYYYSEPISLVEEKNMREKLSLGWSLKIIIWVGRNSMYQIYIDIYSMFYIHMLYNRYTVCKKYIYTYIVLYIYIVHRKKCIYIYIYLQEFLLKCHWACTKSEVSWLFSSHLIFCANFVTAVCQQYLLRAHVYTE